MRVTRSPNISIPLGRRLVRSRWLGAVGDERRRKRQLAAEISVVQGSSLFDCEWYLWTYPDVAQAGRDPLVHYLEIGWREGRDPGPHFGTSAYLKANADVARSAVNPLVHFIEFGRAEGRGSFDPHPLPATPDPTRFDFPDAAPCATFALPDDDPVRWHPSYCLDSDRRDSVMYGHWVAGYAPNAKIGRIFRSALCLLAEISGFAAEKGPPQARPHADFSEGLADAWYVNLSQLRTRWSSCDYPFVVRAFQCDPLRAGEFTLVGEGRVGSQIDCVDVNLKNRFFPVLFVFAEPAGRLRGSRLLAFPSLCRGGIHYAELLSSAAESRGAGANPFTLGDRLCADMLKLRRLESTPAVSNIAIELYKADGTGPLFQPDFQEWLRTVAGVSVIPVSGSATEKDAVLIDAVRLSPADDEERRGDTLFLNHDEVPTISALTAAREQHSRDSVGQIHLLMVGAEPCWPAISLQAPVDIGSFGRRSAQGSWLGNAASEGRDIVTPVAIRLARTSGVADSEFFMPTVDEAVEDTANRQPITWLIDPRAWERHLGHAISCIERQAGAGADVIAFIHRPDAATAALVTASGARARIFKDLNTALAEMSTPLAAFVGQNVLLHNRLAGAYLSELLQNDAVSTASCVIISAEKAGSAWHAATLDQGAVSMGPVLAHQEQDRTGLAEQMWRMDYPVREPSPYLWCTRSSLLADWIADGSGGLRPALHLCSARVSASHVGRGEPTRLPPFVPRAADDMVTRAELLFG